MQKGIDQDAVAQILDHLMYKRPDSDFPKFCECLKKSEQGHIVEKYFSGTCIYNKFAFFQKLYNCNLSLLAVTAMWTPTIASY